MLEASWVQLQALLGLGLGSGEMGPLQIALRAILVYASTLVIVRLGSKRFLSEASAFDVIVSIMLGSIMSRAIDGSSPFWLALVAGAALLALHWLFGVLAFRTTWFGTLVKGEPVLLIRDGEVQHDGMRRGSITMNDLTEALRQETKQTDPAKIKVAYLERNGKISAIPRQGEPSVLDISVADGVQTVRLKVE